MGDDSDDGGESEHVDLLENPANRLGGHEGSIVCAADADSDG